MTKTTIPSIQCSYSKSHCQSSFTSIFVIRKFKSSCSINSKSDFGNIHVFGTEPPFRANLLLGEPPSRGLLYDGHTIDNVGHALKSVVKVSAIFAMYGLGVVYKASRTALPGWNPTPKFVALKAVLIVTVIQGFIVEHIAGMMVVTLSQ